jgi:hypothetical protein
MIVKNKFRKYLMKSIKDVVPKTEEEDKNPSNVSKKNIKNGLLKMLNKASKRSIFKSGFDENEERDLFQSIKSTPKTFLSMNASGISNNETNRKSNGVNQFNFATNDNNSLVASIEVDSDWENYSEKSKESKENEIIIKLRKENMKLKKKLKSKNKTLKNYKNKIQMFGVSMKKVRELCRYLMQNSRKGD